MDGKVLLLGNRMVLTMIETDQDGRAQISPAKWTTLQLVSYWVSNHHPGSVLYADLLDWYDAYGNRGSVVDYNED